MGSFGGYFKGEKRKQKKEILERKAEKISRNVGVPTVEIIGKKGNR